MTGADLNGLYDLLDGNPGRNIAAIKDSVINRIKASDRGVRIETTEYFNHSFAPDLVLHWDRSETREVYLRTAVLSEYLLEDLDLVVSEHPIMMPLTTYVPAPAGEAASKASEGQTLALEQRANETNALVAPAASIDALEEIGRSSPVVRLLTRAVLQGGRGVVAPTTAQNAGATMGAGFDGAATGDLDPTTAAVHLVEDLLDVNRAGRMNRLLQAMWLSSGASASAFPGASGVTASLDGESLQFMVDGPDIEDDTFWARLGRAISLARLCEIHAEPSSGNLQRLVRGSLDGWQARSSLVEMRAEPDLKSPVWLVNDGKLGLRSRKYTAWVSPHGTKSFDRSTPEQGSSSIAEVLLRAREAGIELLELELEADSGQRIDFRGQDADVSQDDLLDRLGDTLGADATVRALTARLGSMNVVRCDLVRNTARGRTVAKFTIPTLLAVAVPMTQTLSGSEREELRNSLGLVNVIPVIVDEAAHDSDGRKGVDRDTFGGLPAGSVGSEESGE